MRKGGGQKSLSNVQRILFVILGSVSLAVGIIGAFLPVLPTTPFVLLSVACYVRSSQRMYTWVMNSRFAGKHVHNVLAGHGIPFSVKVVSVVMSFCMIGYVSVFQTDNFFVRLLLGMLFVAQIIFMVRIKTLRPHERSESTILNLQPTNDLPDLR